ncbi:hypothetical protein N7533_008552 [Penicillium manginii]|uniref:uncharacterized protein n=1 Tax=Penicillium manginii TaxID=203109 RepID=UPI0025474C9E|nr:uncharacterized protein N7533_008552 [Penicillium manginii]KAJ5743682.1 hypothetical protein N7533_008552 [Penicillium manginii]
MDSCGQDPKDPKDPKGEDRATGAETNLVEAGVYLYMGYIWISHPFSSDCPDVQPNLNVPRCTIFPDSDGRRKSIGLSGETSREADGFKCGPLRGGGNMVENEMIEMETVAVPKKSR